MDRKMQKETDKERHKEIQIETERDREAEAGRERQQHAGEMHSKAGFMGPDTESLFLCLSLLSSSSSCSISFHISPSFCVPLCLSLHFCLFLAFFLSHHLSVSLVSLPHPLSLELWVSASHHLIPVLLPSPPPCFLTSLLYTGWGRSQGWWLSICLVSSLPGTVWAVADKAWGGWGLYSAAFQRQTGRAEALMMET